MAIDFKKPTRQRLIDLIRETNPKSQLSLNDVVLGTPSVVDMHGRNTRVVITVSPTAPVAQNGSDLTGQRAVDKRLSGQRTVFYDRIHLADFMDGKVLTVDTETSTHDLLPLLFEQHGVRIDPEDIVDEALTGTYVIRATPGSYGWIGEATLETQNTVTYPVIVLDSGAPFSLDSGALLLND